MIIFTNHSVVINRDSDFMKRSPLFFIILFAILPSFHSFAQQSTINGVVKDFSTKSALPFVNVFVNGTTYGTQSDEAGKFKLTFPLTQKAELVFSSVGYTSKSVFITVGITSKTIDIELAPQIEALKEFNVSGKKDKEWKRNFEMFKRSFLGTDGFAKQTEIDNYWVIDFDKEKLLLKANSNEPLTIKNESLGYEILTELVKFEGTQSTTDYLVKSFYKELPIDDSKLAKRDKLRKEAYDGSLRHFLKSLAQSKLKENGFDFFLLEGNTIRRGSSFSEYTTTKYDWDFFDSSVGQLNSDSSFSFSQGATFIILNRNKSTGPQPLFKDINSATSLLHISGRHRIDKDGNVDEPLALQVSGDMDTYRFARTLPTDYQPNLIKTEPALKGVNNSETSLGGLKTLTNKDIFVPGERLYFTSLQEGQGFSDYQPLNVCLYDSVGVKIDHQYFRFLNGRSSGYVLLDKQLPAGQYYLQFFTNWMSAYPELISVKSVLVLKGKLPAMVNMCSNEYADNTVTAVFKEMEIKRGIINDSVQRITLVNIPPQVENMSVAVASGQSLITITDAGILPTPGRTITVSETKFRQLENSDSLLVISGKLVNKVNKKPLRNYTLTLAAFDPANKFVRESQTDGNGNFNYKGVAISGEQTLVYQITDRRNRDVTYGEVLLDKSTHNVLKLNCKMYPLLNETIDFTKSDRFISDDTLSTLLNEVEVLASKTPRDDRDDVENGLSKKSFTDDSPRYTSIINMLEQLAGVQYNYASGKLIVRNNFYDEPLVLVNDIAINNPNDMNKETTDIKDRLDQFSPNDVESVEILKAFESTLYGLRGNGGIIKITLKKGFIAGKSGKPVAGTILFSGFSPTTTDVFSGNKTLYWNPEVTGSQIVDGNFSFDIKNVGSSEPTLRIMGKLFDGKVVFIQSKVR